ncbi:MAG: BatA domain-containing protein [Candidatus Omnitrophica bacterium]|nr:BatA domain-containing protein [Candidatus Omnitrophota bacterium]
MTFLQPVFLWALAGAGLPVLLHFLAKRKAKPFPFSTLRFLKISRQTTGRLRLVEEWLVLFLRIIIIMLLIFFLAGPVSQRFGGFLQEQSVVLVIDDSYSLSAGGNDSPWHDLQSAGLQLFSALRKPVRVAIAFSSGKSLPFTQDLKEAETIIRTKEVSFASGSIQAALEQARKLLSGRSGEKIIFVFSDFQSYAWDGVSFPETDRGSPRIVLVDLGRTWTDNAGIKKVVLLPAERMCQCQVVNWNGHQVTAEVEFQAGQTERKMITLLPRETQSVQFKLPRTAGLVKARLLRSDLLSADNEFFINIPSAEETNFLLASGSAETGRYVRLALEASFPQAKLEFVHPQELGQKALLPYRIVFLVNAGRHQPETIRSLAHYLQQGGQLVVFVGDKDVPDNFNSDWQLRAEKVFLMPARLGQVVKFARPATVLWGDKHHPFFAPLGDGLLEYWKTVYFHQVFQCSVVDGQVLLKSERDLPLLMESRYGTGTVVLFAFPPDLTWTNLPKRPFYPVLMEVIGQTLAIASSPISLVGQPIWAPPETEFLTAVSPDGEKMTLQGSRGEILKFIPEKPGAWQFSFVRQGVTTFRLVAVNLDWQEGDLSKMEPTRIRACFPKAAVKIVPVNQLARYLKRETSATDLSPIFLILLLILYLLQVGLGNFFHWKKTERQVSSSPVTGEKK